MKKIYISSDITVLLCDSDVSDPILSELYSYRPLKYIGKSSYKQLKKKITIADNILNDGYKIGGLYLRKSESIIINGGAIDLLYSCTPNISSKDINEFAAIVIGHELIHYTVFNKFEYKFIRPIAKQFYDTFWKSVLFSKYKKPGKIGYKEIADANLILGMGAFDSWSRKVKLLSTFKDMLRIIYRDSDIEEYTKEYIVVLDKLVENPAIPIDPFIKQAFINAYVSIYDGIPQRTKFGQELIDISEIFACSSQTDTNEARSVAKYFLSRL